MRRMFAAVEPVVAETLNSPTAWVLAILRIVAIDIVLAGDNAVVIALAVRRLEKKERLWGITLGAGMAVVLRVGLTFVAQRLLAIPYLKLVGGLLILWIAVKLLVDHDDSAEGKGEAGGLWQAVWLIMVADITMSLDNVVAVAGAARDNFSLLLFGLGLSIPLVVFASNLLSKLMDRFPIIVYAGSAVLGTVAGEMMLKDRAVTGWLHPTGWLIHAAEIFLAVAVIVAARIWCRVVSRREKKPGGANH